MKKISNLSKSLDLKTNKFVQACAGAGKTFALSKRYCAILDDFADKSQRNSKQKWLGVKNILVITFTNKAAGEMKSRIYKDLNILLSGEEITELKDEVNNFGIHLRNEKNANYKEWLKSTFSQNMISTIDGFCSKILKENAYKIGIDPMFVLEDESIAKKNRDELFDEFMQTKSKDLDKDLKKILYKINLSTINEYLTFFDYHKYELDGWFKRISEKKVDEIWQDLLENYMPDFDFDIDDWIVKIKDLLNGIENKVLNKNSKEYKKILHLNRILSDINNQPISKEIIFLTELSSIFMNKDNAYYKQFLGSNSKWIDSDYKKTVLNIFNDEFKIAFPSEIVNSIPNRQDYESILIFKSLIKLYFDFEKIHNEYKDKRNYLTFNDVLILTNKILEDERVCEKYRDLYSHIMIDEFQDTNDLRWNIIRKIASDKNGKLRENGLFVVGDIKQSIYGFANADVKIMDIARNEIIKSNGDIVDFNNNFRSSENYIENVINKIFPNVMLNSENERESYEAFFEPTEIADANQSSQNIETNTNICATVGLCRNNSEEKNEDIEILQTVKYVKDAIKWADKNKQNLEKNNGPIIAVLLRKFTKIQNYLKIFQQYNIDFEIVTSKGLFNKQETYDIFHFISIMVNPYDDVALIGLLRSPFFALSDYDIHDLLSKRGKEKSVYEMVNSDKKFQYISKEIVKWRNLLKEYSIDKLLNKIISSNDCKLGYFSEVGGRQRLANFDKILNIISQLVLDGVGLNAIYDFFKFQIQQKTDISEAELPSVKKVQIMTMHKAKGLEFPVVILPDLAGSKNSDKSRIKIGEIKNNKNEYMQEIGISLVDEYDETKKSNLLYRIKKYDALKVEAEEKRLFYVTITRAIYKIYLLADTTKMKDKSKAQNWWNTFIRDSYNVPNEFSEKSIEKNEKTKTAIEKYFIDDIESEINQYEDNKKTMEEKWVDYKTLKWNKKYNSFNPHDIMDLIFPNEKYSNSTSDTGEFNRIFGIIFHKVMEMKWWDLEEDRDKIEKYIELEYPEISREKVIVKLKSHLEKLRER